MVGRENLELIHMSWLSTRGLGTKISQIIIKIRHDEERCSNLGSLCGLYGWTRTVCERILQGIELFVWVSRRWPELVSEILVFRWLNGWMGREHRGLQVSRYGHFNSHERDIDHRDSTGLFSRRSVMTESENLNGMQGKRCWMERPNERPWTYKIHVLVRAPRTDQTYVTTAGGRDCDSSETKTCFIRVQGWKIKNTSGEMEWLSGERDLDRWITREWWQDEIPDRKKLFRRSGR